MEKEVGRNRNRQKKTKMRKKFSKKKNKWPELLNSRCCKLVMTGMKIDDRWSEEAWSFLEQLAKVKAKTVPVALRRSTKYCFFRRWSQILAVAAQSAFAATLLGEPTGRIQAWNDQAPDLGEALHDREIPAEGPSRWVEGWRQLSGLKEGVRTDCT